MVRGLQRKRRDRNDLLYDVFPDGQVPLRSEGIAYVGDATFAMTPLEPLQVVLESNCLPIPARASSTDRLSCTLSMCRVGEATADAFVYHMSFYTIVVNHYSS